MVNRSEPLFDGEVLQVIDHLFPGMALIQLVIVLLLLDY
jgi:hypothetical protein